MEERKLENPEKNPRSKDENQQQTHIIYIRIIDIMMLLVSFVPRGTYTSLSLRVFSTAIREFHPNFVLSLGTLYPLRQEVTRKYLEMRDFSFYVNQVNS